MIIELFICTVHFILGARAWPEGTYGLPMSKTGCPDTADLKFDTGTRTQMTNKGSHTSAQMHLAGIEHGHLNHMVQLFCLKLSYPQYGPFNWMPGKYCIFKKGDCPAKFQEGFIKWDDATSWYNNEHRQTFTGILPEGEFDEQTTKIEYCCRSDGSPYNPIPLPSEASFYLIKHGDFCQEVDRMVVSEEWIHWSGDGTSGGLSSLTARATTGQSHGGTHPKILRSPGPRPFTKIFYCYYQPKPPNRTLQILTFMLYGIGSLVAISMLGSTVACLSRFLCGRLCCKGGIKEGVEWYNTNDFMPPVSRQPSQQPPTTAPDSSPRVFKYVTVVTGDVVATAVENGNNNITPASNIFIPNTTLINNNNNQTFLCHQQPHDNNNSGGFTYSTIFPEVPHSFNNNNNDKQPPIVPSAPANWDLPQQHQQQPQQQHVVATRLLVINPTDQVAINNNINSINNNINVPNVYPYLPSYSDAVNYK